MVCWLLVLGLLVVVAGEHVVEDPSYEAEDRLRICGRGDHGEEGSQQQPARGQLGKRIVMLCAFWDFNDQGFVLF